MEGGGDGVVGGRILELGEVGMWEVKEGVGGGGGGGNQGGGG